MASRQIKFLFGILLLLSVAVGQVAPIRVSSPAASGMNTTADVQENKPTDSRYLLNAEMNRQRGLVERRHGIHAIGDNAIKVFDATGFVDQAKSRKQIVAIVPGPDSILADIDNGDSTWFHLPSDTALRQISVSLLNSSNAGDSTIVRGNVYTSGPVDMVHAENEIVISSPNAPAYVYVPELTAAYKDHFTDTGYFRPRVEALSLEAPGQPRVIALNDTTGAGITGTVRYAYGNTINVTPAGDTGVWQGKAGLPSMWIHAKNQKVIVSLFEGHPENDSTTLERIVLFRQYFGLDWAIIDTFSFYGKDEAVYVDSLPADSVTTYDFGMENPDQKLYTDKHWESGYGYTGSMSMGFIDTLSVRDTSYPDTNFSVPTDTALFATIGADYWVAFSYYDPLTKAESPLGPPTWGTVADNDGWMKAYTKVFERAPYIRVYRSKTLDDFPNLYFYGLYELSANDCYPISGYGYERVVFPFFGSDSALDNGLTSHVNDSISFQLQYRDEDILFAEEGGALVRPEFIDPLQVTFTDMEYVNYRMWGIGDPLYPSRLYYSYFDDARQWNAVGNYLPLDEGAPDALVALAKLSNGSDELLYAFKGNRIFVVSGYDVEYDLQYSVLTTECGALSKKSLVVADDKIFFLSPDMRIYATAGAKPENISVPIENWIDSFFVSADSAAKTVVAYQLGRTVQWYANGKALVFNLDLGLWSIATYDSNCRVAGTFVYDSTAGQYRVSEYDRWLFQSDSAEQFRVLYQPATDSTDTAWSAPFRYLTPYVIGDGEYKYGIQTVQMSAQIDSGASLYVAVVDENLDTVGVDTIASVSGEMQTYYIGFPKNEGVYLALDMSTSTNNKVCRISELLIGPERKGKVGIH